METYLGTAVYIMRATVKDTLMAKMRAFFLNTQVRPKTSSQTGRCWASLTFSHGSSLRTKFYHALSPSLWTASVHFLLWCQPWQWWEQHSPEVIQQLHVDHAWDTLHFWGKLYRTSPFCLISSYKEDPVILTWGQRKFKIIICFTELYMS